MKHPDQNQNCPHEAGTISCLSATWSISRLKGEGNPCYKCQWWDDFCGDEILAQYDIKDYLGMEDEDD